MIHGQSTHSQADGRPSGRSVVRGMGREWTSRNGKQHCIAPFQLRLIRIAFLAFYTFQQCRNCSAKQTGLRGPALCVTLFSCVECLRSQGCAWCLGQRPSCIDDYQRDMVCKISTSQSLITSNPPGQICPAALFDGEANSPKTELPRTQGGFATASIPRTETDPKWYTGTFVKKKPTFFGLLGGNTQPTYKRDDPPSNSRP